jgi:hypothetical protein
VSRSEEELDALVADLDEAEVIDVITDAMYDKVRVGRLRDAALVGVQGSPGILDTPDLRERFGRAYREACRRAAGEPPEMPLTCDGCSHAAAAWMAAMGRANADRSPAPGHVLRLLCDDCGGKTKETCDRAGRAITFIRLGVTGVPGE